MHLKLKEQVRHKENPQKVQVLPLGKVSFSADSLQSFF
jgi:hypothetical protein